MPPKKPKVVTPEVTDEPKVDLISRGEDAKKLLADAYFVDLIERMDEAYRREVLGLRPDATSRFSAIQERRQGLIDLRGSIIGDAEAARKELAKMHGETNRGRVA